MRNVRRFFSSWAMIEHNLGAGCHLFLRLAITPRSIRIVPNKDSER